ncbi:unnamed protein product [Didymodactylos carnosus]|uniref:Uncharacterized protein n=1 Tax=Didymodactylos carnosus TaxID=1234261 RepID=A0A8S2PIP0_9BILA|nr:unnamed protein product [Didymodactylos carnosus]CAF4052530.1 unnamed protein product [Didymodactylos carnosus]
MGCLNSVDGLSAWPSTCQTTARYATSRNSAEQSEPHYENILLEELLDIHKYSTKLVLINRNLNDQDMKILATYIKINQFLNQLDLTSNEITCTGVVYLMEAILNFNSTLTEISFSNNQLGDIGVKILALYLKRYNNLSYIDLSSNNVTDVGLYKIANMLTKNRTLIKLNLNGNQIRDPGIEKLTYEIEKNTTLKQLYLQSNRITDRSIPFIIKLIQIHILKLSGINGNLITQDDIQKIKNSFTINKQ